MVRARYEELFTLVAAELRRSGFDHLIAAGIVLTGGASMVNGAVDLAESIFQMPVRQGMPQYVTCLTDVLESPIYATAVGVLLNAHQRNQMPASAGRKVSRGQTLLKRMRSWFQGQF